MGIIIIAGRGISRAICDTSTYLLMNKVRRNHYLNAYRPPSYPNS